MSSNEPQKISAIEKYLRFAENKGLLRQSQKLNIGGFSPKLSSISSGSGLAIGIRFWNPNMGETAFDLGFSAARSLRGYRYLDLQLGKVERKSAEFLFTANNWGGITNFGEAEQRKLSYYAYLDLRYRNFPQEDLYGLGANSLEGNRTNYALRDKTFDVVAGKQLNRWLGLGIRAGYYLPGIFEGQDSRFPDARLLFNELDTPGLESQPDFFRWMATAFLDYRDNPGNTHKGGIMGFSLGRFNGINSDSYDFNRYSFDARHYVPLGSVQRVLATRLFISGDNPSGDSQVPFYLQDYLGGSETLRGYPEFRFRDRKVLAIAAEYRWEAFPAWELAVFYDAGKVFGDVGKFNLSGLKKSYGIGTRFKTKDGTFLRLDYARGAEGSRFIISYGPSF